MPEATAIFAGMHIVVEWPGHEAEKEEQKQYLHTLLATLLAAQPGCTITILTSADVAGLAGMTQQKVEPPTSYFGLRSWYRKRLPQLLKQQKADFLISINGAVANTTIPQLAVITNNTILLRRSKGSFSFLYKKFVRKNLTQAARIACISSSQKEALVQQLSLKPEKITPLGYAVPAICQPLDWQQREAFLQQQNGGREYFLYTGAFSGEEVILALKAFSLFKKRQQSNMQLIIAGQFYLSKDLSEKLETYKYRSDVVLLPGTPLLELNKLTAASYAVVFAGETAITAYPAAVAMQCSVPVIGFETNMALAEVTGPAALYATATQEGLAEQMKLVYKDELLRQQLIRQAQAMAAQVDGNMAAQSLWNLIEANTL